ncbi:hypothetical protein Rsub_04434 [Raphidocelis subcapitata]|uniref:Uncharacterized protein n=1 Tax=Raphidocelis subcapitata TaxID=307507 RepID=A0A2V0P4G6_9CHLO|nr:hypothetical protein Rsub_04434 [Raphidocelis subcapitata]|eukprot:GBF92087.1 hypothetical protein Rsub_04434 [Raphidocelis subcapitata]
MAAHVAALSLEAYLELHAALTAGSPHGAARAVSAIEEPYFRLQDLRQLLLVHGLAAGKFARGDMLRAMVGCPLIDPTSAEAAAGGGGEPARPAAASLVPAAAPPPSPPPPPLHAADLVALGWAEGPGDALQAALQSAPPLLLPRLPAAAAGADGSSGAPAAAPPAAAAAQQLAAAGGAAEAAALASPPTAAERAPQQPAAPPAAVAGQLDQGALLALLQQHGLLPANLAPGAGAPQLAAAAPGSSPAVPPLKQPQPQQQLAGGAWQTEGGHGSTQPPPTQPPAEPEPQAAEHPHTDWLRGQLAVFASLPGCRAAAREELGEPGAAALAGRRVAFVLPQEMEVDAGRGAVLRLPAGVFQGRAIRFLGTACRPALCETTCAGGHFFYAAKIIPPPPDALEAMAAAAASTAAGAAAAAASGSEAAAAPGARTAPTAGDYAVALSRPIELELDLHPRLRAREAGGLLLLDAEALQDAWVLLERGEPVPAGGGGGGEQAAAEEAAGKAAAAQAAPARGRGRPAAKRSRRG